MVDGRRAREKRPSDRSRDRETERETEREEEKETETETEAEKETEKARENASYAHQSVDGGGLCALRGVPFALLAYQPPSLYAPNLRTKKGRGRKFYIINRFYWHEEGKEGRGRGEGGGRGTMKERGEGVRG